MWVCSASLHPSTKSGLQNAQEELWALPLGVDPVVPVHSWASESSRGLVGPVAPVLAKVGALGQVGLPVQVLPPHLGGSLAEVTKLGSRKGNNDKMCWGAVRTSPVPPQPLPPTALLSLGKTFKEQAQLFPEPSPQVPHPLIPSRDSDSTRGGHHPTETLIEVFK